MSNLLTTVLDRVLETTIVGSFTTGGYEARRRLHDWNDLPSMKGKTVLLTGGTSGIGRATASSLHALGADVVVTSRSLDRANTAAGEIAAAHGGEGSVTGAELDTADFGSINTLVDRMRIEFGSVDVLINNAGALTDEHRTSEDGIELTLASHLVGPYHLMTSLRPLMPTGSRVLWMSSGGMYTQGLDVDTIEMDAASFKGAAAYAKAKRGQVELVHHLAPTWAPEIVMHAMHPGWVATNGVDQGLPGFSKIMGPLLRKADQGADTMVWLASGGADAAEPGGFYLDRAPRGTVYAPGTGTNRSEREKLVEWLDLMTLPARNSASRGR